MKISIVSCSRLHVNPVSKDGNLYLDRALMSVRRQSCFANHEWEFIVGLDKDAPGAPSRFSDVVFARSDGNGQAKALNAALAHATGDVLAFVEDDDSWRPNKMAEQLPRLDDCEMVTSNQREIDEYANYIRVNDFATMSGWVVTRDAFFEAGVLDESFRWHLDTEWLGRANLAGIKRVHVVEPGGMKRLDQPDSWLSQVKRWSDVVETDSETDPLVDRLVNPKGGMSTIASDATAAQESLEEHRRMIAQFSTVPW